MTARAIREIQFEKGESFTTKFILDFSGKWEEITQGLRNSGVNLNIPLAKK